ncbi:MAG: hypothetical protein IKF60_03215 [Solobacterium sp.]|nr:hypothetical protein [Solobacterium sp.]
MKLLKKLLSSIVILFLVLTVFFSTLAVGLFVYGEVSGQQLIPEFHTVQDAKRWLKSVGESTNIPLLSSYLSSIKTSDTPSADVTEQLQTYDSEFYPYFQMLNADQKIVYAQLVEAVEGCQDSLTMSVYGLDYEAAEDVWEAVFYDHPELFWLEESASFHYYPNGGVTSIDLHYNELADNLEYHKSLFDEAVNGLLGQAQQYSSSYDKEIYLHNALVELCEYDLHASCSQSAYSALVNHSSVCAGYAKAYQLLMMRCGIPCYYASGWSGENHAWNITQIDDEFYNVDVTWDDGTHTFIFFNRTDADLAGTHQRMDLSLQLPACQGELHHNTEPIPPIDINALSSGS